MSKIDKRTLLAGSSIFQGLEDRDLDALAEVTVTKRLKGREVLFHKGEMGSELYGVLSGRLRISAAGPDGKGMVFTYADPGEVLGEISLIDSHPRSATVEAAEASELMVLHRRVLMPFLKQHPEIAIQMAQVVAARLRRVSEQVEDAYLLSLPARLARKVIALARVYGKETPKGVTLEIPLAQQEIGELIGATRESVNKILRRWTENELVEVDQKIITIRNADGLQDVADMFVD